MSLTGKFDEGQIEYQIEYLEDSKEKPIVSLLPTTMLYQFKDNNYIQEVEGWMGVFKMAGIKNVNEDFNAALLKIMADKYVYKGDLAFGYDEYPGMKVVFTDETKEIASIKCKKANIVFDGDEYENFSVYYTDKINVENPNQFNPFKEIPGVLMEYQYELFNITTHLVATKVDQIEIDETVFEIPSGYKSVSKDEMEEVINNLM
ncbi:MAG: hypothetical protein Kow0068_23590 [Marinilabiliales bacterium]